MGWACELEGVGHRYGPAVALDDVHLQIPAGVMAGLIGPDGVGKSTLLALLAGVRRLQAGRIVTLGTDIASARARASIMPRIAYMPQGLGRNLYPTLSVRENLDFFGRLFGQPASERAERIAMLLEATGLDPFPDRPAGKLSGGMKQKLSLCCALIHDPALLILDEPTTGVDPLSRRQFWELIDRMRVRMPSMSVIVATAYMEEAERFDWLAAVNGGRIISSGSPQELKNIAGADTLEEAFVNLLPESERGRHRPVELRPRKQRPEADPAISATGLTKRFGDFTAVDNVSFEIEEGEIFGFLGSNGCGKSTTMKMLTGLLEPTEGETRLFGKRLANADMEARLGIGYMSQSFSLYSELTVRQNLALHARLYGGAVTRVDDVLQEFDLADVADQQPESLPLGIRQRLQLAVATIHEPRILILDEPTSGVDPVARDSFWRKLISLSRDKGVTIFISTHFMNEAERCDRVSLMHAGKVLAVGTPAELTEKRGNSTLEEAFIGWLEDETGERATEPAGEVAFTPDRKDKNRPLTRLWAYASRETLELMRDPVRLFFAFMGPAILLFTIGYGISFDVDHITFAVYDQDQSPESRRLSEQFTSIRQFDEGPPISSPAEIDTRMGRGTLTVALEIPSGFGRDLHRGHVPEVSLWVDGSMPFRAETAHGYVLGVLNLFSDLLAKESGRAAGAAVSIETRYRFNQAFKSAYAMVPSVVMLILMLTPAIMAAIGVAREKETGTIANFRSTPVTRLEFLTGKQLPYIAVAVLNFWTLYLMGRLLFGVPFTGNLFALFTVSVIYVIATTGLGQLVSSFTRTQVSAVFATAVITIIPTVNFSGLIVPVSSLTPSSQLLGKMFPGAWYQEVSVGSFVKAYGWSDMGWSAAMLCAFVVIYLALSVLALRKQER
ncbi:ABC transporter, 2 fused ATPase and 1 inner membrane subunits [Roseibium aggregatum IAM 12614]|uniref:ABC transporter, 2 fused ATPase and 1 inner membrane subunits n=1 Tax=Roseibium aggregatum (strain ATCC 25650 / DSM 13394 / JCM 20685 / NBRC 16684 / NCIMB 2208 / IAM 12614 / B1) TaxID=384765 RepID=A0NSB3_ROSAI|nr:ribosome-associated ATPase/putative transporter RbbA [Roseibium aggregatum]EAV44442.1 ABC transporter, 2 fused ATPase and 1 inner membrane subunits [Roseibium aggregatum IAM 12614]